MLHSLLYTVLVRSWWVIVCLFVCTILYEQALKERERLYRQLDAQLFSLQQEKQEALRQQKNLQLQINSQSDLSWIELTLMKGLGLTPEDQQKVYFYSDSNGF